MFADSRERLKPKATKPRVQIAFKSSALVNALKYFNISIRTIPLMSPLKAVHSSWLGPALLVCCLAYQGSAGVFFFCSGVIKLFGAQGSPSSAAYSICQSSFLIHHGGYHDFLSLMIH